jgi:hypothetical protein
MDNKWPTALLVLGALVLPPILGLAFVIGMPHKPADTASQTAFLLFPLMVLLLTGYGVVKARSTGARIGIGLVALASTAVTWVVLAVLSMAG